MMQNPAIDVAIGLILMYLLLSLLCTVINEFIATKLKLRAKSLASALEQLLDHPPLRVTFYQHGLIATNRRATAIGPQSTLSGIGSIASAARSAVVSGVKSIRTAPAAAPSADPSVPAVAPSAPATGHPAYLSGGSIALALIGSLDLTKPVPG